MHLHLGHKAKISKPRYFYSLFIINQFNELDESTEKFSKVVRLKDFQNSFELTVNQILNISMVPTRCALYYR